MGNGVSGSTEEERRQALAAYLKAKMIERGVSFPELGRRLAEQSGQPIERTVLFNKIKRGSFSAAFLVEVLEALGLDPAWAKEVEHYLPSSPGKGK